MAIGTRKSWPPKSIAKLFKPGAKIPIAITAHYV